VVSFCGALGLVSFCIGDAGAMVLTIQVINLNGKVRAFSVYGLS
jgi:hypothetical protein